MGDSCLWGRWQYCLSPFLTQHSYGSGTPLLKSVQLRRYTALLWPNCWVGTLSACDPTTIHFHIFNKSNFLWKLLFVCKLFVKTLTFVILNVDFLFFPRTNSLYVYTFTPFQTKPLGFLYRSPSHTDIYLILLKNKRIKSLKQRHP